MRLNSKIIITQIARAILSLFLDNISSSIHFDLELGVENHFKIKYYFNSIENI
jgi:hypothetical protein